MCLRLKFYRLNFYVHFISLCMLMSQHVILLDLFTPDNLMADHSGRTV
jgi:hypothetical protein